MRSVVDRNVVIRRIPVLYILIYMYSDDGFKEPKHVAVNYLKWQLIKVVLDCIYYYFIYWV
jgi:hypothetical protein